MEKMSQMTSNTRLLDWVEEVRELCGPDDVVWCDGSQEQFDLLADKLVAAGTLKKLNPAKRPNSYWAHSDPRDVARVESRTYICSRLESDAGPTNNWRNPEEMRKHMTELYSGSMAGRTLYVVPFSMGPVGSPFSMIGVELTDSPYVVLSMSIMAAVGQAVLDELGDRGDFVPCLHSVGQPIKPGEQDVPWPCDPDETVIAHFPESREIWSYGSGYGGNALLGKKCLALRIASAVARDEGWLAEHMLILKLTSPRGEVHYVAGAFPSACGKTNLAMLVPAVGGWKVETVGDDIAWMRFGEDGRLWAVNPEAGFFGVAPGTSQRTNPNALKTLTKNVIFTNTALTHDDDVWWEGLTDEVPEGLTTWKGEAYDPASGPAAHPNARFTVSAAQAPQIAQEWQRPEGVPISAILFGGRRASLIPLVSEAHSWEHGVFLGSIVASETTAAAEGSVGNLRRDPFAMLPFCGYNMGDYFAHWLATGARADVSKLPRIYLVNWFRKGSDGSFLWPGFGDNARVLAWIVDRLEGRVGAVETPFGRTPKLADLNTDGLSIDPSALEELCSVDRRLLVSECESIEEHFSTFGDHLPKELAHQLDQLREQLLEVVD